MNMQQVLNCLSGIHVPLEAYNQVSGMCNLQYTISPMRQSCNPAAVTPAHLAVPRVVQATASNMYGVHMCTIPSKYLDPAVFTKTLKPRNVTPIEICDGQEGLRQVYNKGDTSTFLRTIETRVKQQGNGHAD